MGSPSPRLYRKKTGVYFVRVLLGWIDIQPDEDGREQDAREEVGGLTVVVRGHAAQLLQACEAALDAVAQALPCRRRAAAGNHAGE